MSARASKPKKAAKPKKAKAKKPGGPAPAPDVYVGLMFVSLAALTLGVIFLVLELGEYGWQLAP
jgi:hypothetical protein